jgi:zinc transporter ZupT
MNSYLLALGLAALPAVSNVVGGLLVDVLPTTKRMLGLVLHVAVGVLLAIASLERFPRITQANPVCITYLHCGENYS